MRSEDGEAVVVSGDVQMRRSVDDGEANHRLPAGHQSARKQLLQHRLEKLLKVKGAVVLDGALVVVEEVATGAVKSDRLRRTMACVTPD